MPQAAELLPSFRDPPLREVAMVLQFDRLRKMRNKHFFLLWSHFKDRYPNVEEHPELPAFREVFGVRRPAPRPHLLKLSQEPAVLRYAFTPPVGEMEHVQVQRDRFSLFWQHAPDQEYPRFPSLLSAFARDFAVFREFIRAAELGDIVPNQCALTYTNRIAKGEGWAEAADLTTLFPFWTAQFTEPLPLEMEDFHFTRVHAIRLAEGAQIGRLYVTGHKEVFPPTGDEAVELDLTVRGPPQSATEDGVIEFFERARRNIVETFAAVTSKRMHELWGRIQ